VLFGFIFWVTCSYVRNCFGWSSRTLVFLVLLSSLASIISIALIVFSRHYIGLHCSWCTISCLLVLTHTALLALLGKSQPSDRIQSSRDVSGRKNFVGSLIFASLIVAFVLIRDFNRVPRKLELSRLTKADILATPLKFGSEKSDRILIVIGSATCGGCHVVIPEILQAVEKRAGDASCPRVVIHLLGGQGDSLQDLATRIIYNSQKPSSMISTVFRVIDRCDGKPVSDCKLQLDKLEGSSTNVANVISSDISKKISAFQLPTLLFFTNESIIEIDFAKALQLLRKEA